MEKLLKYQTEYLKSIKKLTNFELVNEYSNLSSGDDYDGCFTDKGLWKFERLKIELTLRLIKSGYLSKGESLIDDYMNKL